MKEGAELLGNLVSKACIVASSTSKRKRTISSITSP